MLYQAVAVVWLASEVVIGITRDAPLRSIGQDRFSGPAAIFFVVLAVWAGYIAGRAFPAAAITPAHSFVSGLGASVALAGIAFRWWAVLTLGRFFTTRVMTRPDQTVVQAGPYRLVRHPSYTGMLITVLGMLLIAANWASLACFPIALPGLAYRIRVEEQALIGALGDPYRDYMRRTKRLVPFVV
jgi:protein-S-isoprenylcysteine O-methyltransferase Ste14